MAIFGSKPWVNPCGKMSFFKLFDLLVFFCLERRFLVLEYRKRNFQGLNCLKKKSWKNGHFWTNSMDHSMEKCQFFDFLNFLFLRPRKALFLVQKWAFFHLFFFQAIQHRKMSLTTFYNEKTPFQAIKKRRKKKSKKLTFFQRG